MVRLAEGFVGVDLRHSFTGGEHSLETEQVAIDTLTICSPGRVLDVSSGGPLEQRSALSVLSEWHENKGRLIRGMWLTVL